MAFENLIEDLRIEEVTRYAAARRDLEERTHAPRLARRAHRRALMLGEEIVAAEVHEAETVRPGSDAPTMRPASLR